jgi:hypothetical protein
MRSAAKYSGRPRRSAQGRRQAPAPHGTLPACSTRCSQRLQSKGIRPLAGALPLNLCLAGRRVHPPSRVIDELTGHAGGRRDHGSGGSPMGRVYRETTPVMVARVTAALDDRLGHALGDLNP